MNKYLTQKVWELRKNIRTRPGTPIVSLEHIEKKTYQLLFMSQGCNNSCTFCNYGFDYNLSLDMVMPELEKINLDDFDIYELELESNGSFLSEREIPYDLFLEILKFVANRNIPVITMESFYETITEKKIQDIKAILGKDQKVCFELGFESSSQRVRKFYNKDIDERKFIEIAKLCNNYEIGLQINVLLGAPFLSRKEQIQDCLDTLDFIYNNMPIDTNAVIFPINIKENTMLKYWQDMGLYKQISSWEFVELLYNIPIEYLDKFTIAWWGNRENAFTKGIIQYPTTCCKCHNRLMKFYKNFYCNWNPDYRKKILNEIWNSRCECDQET